MALNPTHTFEDLDGVKCAVVEKNCTSGRVEFLRGLLELNGFTVIAVKSPPPKTAPAKPAAVEGIEVPPPPLPPLPDTFTVGVTDVTFSPVNAVFNRELKTPGGQVVTAAYWKQREDIAKKDEWYWKN